MSDRFQVTVGLDADEGRAPLPAERVAARPVARGIAPAPRTRCVPGRSSGRPPGPRGLVPARRPALTG
ncbi:hypothetical protein ACF09K_14605 [Streptomyces sp. NPDC014882]|uniref:hypothetical protein n=1 Tax=Streptomyces sp. NPDC014882 TaxID=3364927 RepID=UPI0036FA8600